MRVLVVEDNPAVLAMIAYQLNDAGITHELVTHTSKAIGVLNSSHTLLITDYGMPQVYDLTGLGLSRRVREIYPALPIILMSVDVIDLTAYPELNIQYFLHKRIENAMFLQIAALVNRYSL